MDANALAENPKRIKIEGKCGDENEDKISHVPDSVLHYILSFLPAKDAVITSTLSTRWRYLWTAIHNFEFYDKLHYATKKQIREKERLFFNFVDKVLFADDISKIQRFSLTCQEFAEVHFKKWIRTVMRRKVEELIISVTNKSICYFPYERFSFELLRIIKIDMDVIVNIPALLCFANLKVLTLKRVAFCCGKSIKEVSINCPVIEELIVSDWTWLKIKKVNISVPMLQKLKITGQNSSHLHDCEIKIHAESLLSVQLDMVVSYEYSLCGLSSLVDAYINLYANTRIQDDTIAHRLVSLLSGIYNVRDLDLSLTSIEVFSAQAFSSYLHSLSQLKHLRISHGCCTSISGRNLINFLSYMPKIESLSFISGIRRFVFKGNGRMLGTTGESFLSGVKLIDMHYFRGIRDQQWFIKFLIKSVRNADQWTIRFIGVQDQRMIAQLTMLAKDSNCVLEFK